MPSTWAAAFGSSPLLRVFVALIGGIIIGFGARWAGGCTSGHGISGTLQRSAGLVNVSKSIAITPGVSQQSVADGRLEAQITDK